MKLSWLDESTFELVITLPKKEVEKAHQAALEALAKEVKLPGFRKGKAPVKLIEKKLNPDKIYQKVIEKLIPQAYLDAVKKHSLAPILEPKITLISAKKGEDWVFKATSCQRPKINLGPWKEAVKKINASAKIWTPEKGSQKPTKEEQEVEKQQRLQEIIQKLVKITKIKISPFLIENELTKRLVSLVDQLQATGLTLEKYLASKGKKIEELKKEYQKEIETNLKLDLVLEKIANEAKIQVETEEINQIIKKAPKQKKEQINPYLLAQILRRQKTLDYLLGL